MSRKNSETRKRILECTWKLLEDEPGSATRMSDIAKAAGISRQAVYLHFPTRAELLVATTRHLDEVKDVDSRLAKSRAAATGEERLEAFIEAWGNYIPEIYGVAKALLAMKDTDEEAAAAWADRMQAVRHGCGAVVKAFRKDGHLTKNLTSQQSIEALWALLSVRHWEQLVVECGWSQKQYIKHMNRMAQAMLVECEQ
ncbi:MAG: TetR/AcrR family transcriptional regulator [Pseudomonadota bacterium]